MMNFASVAPHTLGASYLRLGRSASDVHESNCLFSRLVEGQNGLRRRLQKGPTVFLVEILGCLRRQAHFSVSTRPYNQQVQPSLAENTPPPSYNVRGRVLFLRKPLSPLFDRAGKANDHVVFVSFPVDGNRAEFGCVDSIVVSVNP